MDFRLSSNGEENVISDSVLWGQVWKYMQMLSKCMSMNGWGLCTDMDECGHRL